MIAPDTTTTSLRARKKHKARQDILASARRLIVEHGYQAAKMRDVAATAGVSYQTLYNYFPGKSALLEALLEDQVARTRDGLRSVLQAYEGGLLPALHRVQSLWLAQVSGPDRALWALVLSRRLRAGVNDSAGVAGQMDQQLYYALGTLLVQAVRLGELRDTVSTALLADTVFALTQHGRSRCLLEAEAPDQVLSGLTRQTALVMTPHLAPGFETEVGRRV